MTCNHTFEIGDYVKVVGPRANDEPGERAAWEHIAEGYENSIGVVTNRVPLRKDIYEIDGDGGVEFLGHWLVPATVAEVDSYDTIELASVNPFSPPLDVQTRSNKISSPLHKYSVGDVVRVIGPGNSGGWGNGLRWEEVFDDFLRTEVTIERLNEKVIGQYEVTGCHTWFAEEWLVPVEDMHASGAKDDRSKPPVALVYESFPNALLDVARVADYGAKKYSRGGWKHVSEGRLRYSDALARHELAQYSEGAVDNESGILHLTHMAWNALALLELKLTEK